MATRKFKRDIVPLTKGPSLRSKDKAPVKVNIIFYNPKAFTYPPCRNEFPTAYLKLHYSFCFFFHFSLNYFLLSMLLIFIG